MCIILQDSPLQDKKTGKASQSCFLKGFYFAGQSLQHETVFTNMVFLLADTEWTQKPQVSLFYLAKQNLYQDWIQSVHEGSTDMSPL